MATITPIVGMCSTTKKEVGFQFVQEGNKLVAKGSFRAYGGNESSATNVSGEFYTASTFRCTCGNNHLYQCCSCGKFICYDGSTQSKAVCPNCGKKDSLPNATVQGRIMCSGSGSGGSADIILAIDVSGSMYGSRLETVKKAAIEDFIKKYSQSCRMALISFESDVVVQSPLTTDLKKIELLINKLLPGGGTTSPLDTVLSDQCFSDFLNASNNRYLVILTDGDWFGSKSVHIAQANKIKAKGVKILTIGCSGADKHFLKKISSPDGSITTKDSGIRNAFATIAKKSSQ